MNFEQAPAPLSTRLSAHASQTPYAPLSTRLSNPLRASQSPPRASQSPHFRV